MIKEFIFRSRINLRSDALTEKNDNLFKQRRFIDMDVRLTLLKNKRFRIITCSQVNYTIAELNTHVVYRQRYVQSTRVFRQLYTRELILLFVSIKRLPIVSTA